MRVHFLQHASYEDPGCVTEWAAERGHSVTTTYLDKDGPYTWVNDIDMLVIMGGPMNVYEELKFPWLALEKKFIGSVIDAGKIVIGICLGAQLIAAALGARIFRNTHKEIGWFPVTMSHQFLGKGAFTGFPQELMAFHWHGDTFDLPADAKRFALSELTLNQGFQYGEKVFGFQFHLECTEENVRRFVAEGKDELLIGGRYVQGAEEILGNVPHSKTMNSLFVDFLDRLAGNFLTGL